MEVLKGDSWYNKIPENKLMKSGVVERRTELFTASQFSYTVLWTSTLEQSTVVWLSIVHPENTATSATEQATRIKHGTFPELQQVIETHFKPSGSKKSLRHNSSFPFPISPLPLPTSTLLPSIPSPFYSSIFPSSPNSFPNSHPSPVPSLPHFLPYLSPLPLAKSVPIHPFPEIQLGLKSAVSSPSGFWGGPQPKANLVHFSREIWHQVAIILVIFVGNCLRYLVLLI